MVEDSVVSSESFRGLVLATKTGSFCSFIDRHRFTVGWIVWDLLKEHDGLEAKNCVQTFTFGQHNNNDLGNNHRPILRLRWEDAPLFPDEIRVESARQKMGDKRANPDGRVPSDVMECDARYRDTLPLPKMTAGDIERFLSKIERSGDDECWEWKAGKRDGYGRLRVGGKLYAATRLMWRLTYGTDPVGQVMCHKCDNPGCCNPSHLFVGTDADNNRDKEKKGRGAHPIGSDNGLSKLSEEDVLTIFNSTERDAELGRRYGVSGAAIKAIRDRKTWTHVTERIDNGDVLRFPRVTGNSKQRRKWHKTQLHEGLVERCLKLTTPANGYVLDPFGGTGTTLRVAKRCGLNSDSIELDSAYCAHIAEEHVMKRLRTKPPTWTLEYAAAQPEELPLFGGGHESD